MEPHILVSPSGDAVMGAFTASDAVSGVMMDRSRMIALDGRIDAFREADLGSVQGRSGAEAILRIISTAGVRGLDDVAADFSVALFDLRSGCLLLTRDATANRPLFWARKGGMVAFASDPDFLIRLGLSDGGLDGDVCAAALATFRTDPRKTGLNGIGRVLGGRWLSFDRRKATSGGRWFRPELDPTDARVTPNGIQAVRGAIETAVRDRARDGNVGLYLSGGRDSGSIALALWSLGVTAECFTMTFDSAVCRSEEVEARQLAEKLGHGWRPVRQAIEIDAADMRWFLQRFKLPIGYPFATSAIATHREITRSKVRTMMEGYGGELFVASPLASLDLMRALRLRAAARSLLAYQRKWVYPLPYQLKSALSSMVPRPLMNCRDRHRIRPPWAARRSFEHVADPLLSRSARDYRLRFLLWEGTSPVREGEDAISCPDLVRTTYPFYDRRVIRAALRLPAEDLIPDPEPKWVLTRTFLGDLSRTRLKGDQEAWFRALARNAWTSHPEVFNESSSLAEWGLVEPEGLRPPFDQRWEVASSALVFTEAWLQSAGERPEA
jgi:asparagine synthetase B (glutamine-hydrolysing)